MASPILLLLALGVAPGDPWELRAGFLGAPRVEVLVPDEEPRAVAERLLGAHPRLEVLAATEAPADPDLPRILALTDPAGLPDELDAPLERMGLAFVDGGFTLFGRSWDTTQDGFAATFEDPGRPGLPVTLWYANSEAALTAYLGGMEPTFVPGFSAFRGGEVELTGELAPDGRLLTGELTDRRGTWLDRFASDKRISLRGFEFRVPATFDPDRAKNYLTVLEAARDRTLAWADAEGTALAAPVAAIGPTHVTVHGHAEELLDLLGGAVLSRVNPVTGHVHVLLGQGMPDDAGAAVAASAARRLLGPPAEDWLAEAAAVSGARSWWGADLDLWVAHLASADLAPDLAAVVAGEGSPHLVAPLRAFWLDHMLEAEGAARLRSLWTGAERLDVVAAGPDFDAALQDHLTAHADELQAWQAKRRRGVDLPWRGGACLVPGPPGAGYGSRGTRTSLGVLAAQGANAVTLRVEAYLEPAEPQRPGRLHRERVAASVSDVVLASALADARHAGLAPILAPHLLVTPHGVHTADVSLSTVARIDTYFQDYEPFLVHYALFAELTRVELLYVGSGLEGSTKPPTGDRSTPANLAMFQAKEAGWRHLVERTRGAFRGALAYAAGSPSEARNLTFLDALDLVAVELFTSLEPSAGSPGAGPGQAPDPARLASKLTGQLTDLCDLAGEHDLPLVISAVGYASSADAWRRPHLSRGATSPETQALLYRALIEARSRIERRQPGVLRGLSLWSWSSYPDAGGLADRGFTPQNKPALELVPELLRAPGDG